MTFQKGNIFSRGLTNNGRPPIFESAEELESKCLEYFEYCNEQEEKATITGLALFLGFESRQSVHDYKDRGDFSYIMKRAMLAVENSYEKGGSAFDIFALKNMGWKDKSEHDHTTNGKEINTNPTIVFKKFKDGE